MIGCGCFIVCLFVRLFVIYSGKGGRRVLTNGKIQSFVLVAGLPNKKGWSSLEKKTDGRGGIWIQLRLTDERVDATNVGFQFLYYRNCSERSFDPPSCNRADAFSQ